MSIIFNLFKKHMDNIPKFKMRGDNQILITRFHYSSYGTFGYLRFRDFECYTVECPWKNNEKYVSCIPDGEYNVSWTYSNKFKKTLLTVNGGTVSTWVDNNYQRNRILFHAGNWPKNFQGCIGLGKEFECVSGNIGVSSSGLTMNQFHKELDKVDVTQLKLIIEPRLGTK